MLLMTGALTAQTTASTLSASLPSLTFPYQVNATALPGSQSVTINATGAAATSTLAVTVASVPSGWLTVTPDTGRAPLALTVSVNPTGLAPGSYGGLITVNTVPAGANPATVNVTLTVKNPAPVLSISSAASNFTTPPPAMTFSFTTGSGTPAPNSAIFNVTSSGDTIPFSVTAAAAGTGSTAGPVWLRVNGANQTPSLKTSGVALSGSSVPFTLTIDPVVLAGLNPGSYTNVVNVVANNPVNGTASISVSLVVAAGPPTVNSIFPLNVVAGQVVAPTITIYGDNFFSTSVVSMQQTVANPPPAVTLTSTLLSRKVLRATVPVAQVAAAANFKIFVTNPAPPSNPSQQPAGIAFSAISATQPAISAIVNSASYLPTATQTGSGANPVPNGGSSLSARELITIFGQNLGPTPSVSAQPAAAVPGGPLTFPTSLGNVTVDFTIPGIAKPVSAPLIMVSGNQINALVPVEVGTVTANAAPGNVLTITVTNNKVTTPIFSATAVDADPGLFSFDGLGKGEAAVLNYDDASGSYIINSTTAPAARSSTVIIYATGLGDLSDATIGNGDVATGATTLLADTVRVDMDGQPAVVTYAGCTPGAVAGLVQINAIVPPTVRAPLAIPITVSVGTPVTARRSQPQVTIAVK
jgi:uncharacterized protein (TIGR03437 family)